MNVSHFDLTFNEHGALAGLFINNDPHHTNWVIDPKYLEQAGYQDTDKLFGEFDLTIAGKTFSSIAFQPSIDRQKESTTVTYGLDSVTVRISYAAGSADGTVDWSVELANRTDQSLVINDFGVWASLAYVMFRDGNVLRNMMDSAAVFPSVSTDFTKLAAVRRSNEGPHLGVYQIEGRTLSVGTYCEYTNLFFENVSPSLDGMLFHKMILAGGYPEGKEPSADWIYSRQALTLAQGETKIWTYRLSPFLNRKDFYTRGLAFGHPALEFSPMVNENEKFRLTMTAPAHVNIKYVRVNYKENDRLVMEDIRSYSEQSQGVVRLGFPAKGTGEHKVTIGLSNGKEDSVVFNVVTSLKDMLNDRVDYISDTLYQGADAEVPYSFLPLSNQGESLGKLSLVLQKNLLDRKHLNIKQVRQVELSAVNYIRPKWFIEGDFTKPRKLYGNFYRVMDFEYIGHVFFLLSQFDCDVLEQHSPDEYLHWAADIFNLRVNADLHADPRAKEETQMLGVFFLYIHDLLAELKRRGLTEKYHLIKEIWRHTTDKVNAESSAYKAAVTEHYYDNAGFGPAAGALSSTGHLKGALRYSRLLEANIGFSNDFRAQAPDRWWEALSYMIHSLWGGVASAAMLQAYEFLKDPAYLEAAYRSTVAVLYCYDTHATATVNRLDRGAAASTYSIAGPNINRPDLSRNRFGQSAFANDGGIFNRLFPDGDTGYSDWDMGEELVAYLNGFGRKTYLYTQHDELRAVNGQLIRNKDGSYTIVSFAPYPDEYIFAEEGLHFIAPAGTLTPKIKLVNHRFVVES